MPALTTARILTVDRAEREEHERRNYVGMIESMVRAGCSEREIMRAVEAARNADA